MTVINEPIEIIAKTIGKQKISNGEYRQFLYTMTVNVESGMLCYNILTRELIYLDYNEISAFASVDTTSGIVRLLIEKWFFVKKKFDDYILFRETDKAFRQFRNSEFDSRKMHFTIFPTTDCNARCFYCFELKNNRRSMTEQTAIDVSNYIIKKAADKIVLTWFGGEPLYNSKVIEIITNKLKEQHIDFSSKMASNAYLFTDELIYTAKHNWNLRWIQITLDGTAANYNRIKSYVYKDEINPFERVINNIEKLLKNGIFVLIRLNIDMHNCDDIGDLLEFLLKKFSPFRGLVNIYTTTLFDGCGQTAIDRTKQIKDYLRDKALYYNELASKFDMGVQSRLSNFRRVIFCMADDNRSVAIFPGGELGKCEHYLDDHYFGSVYKDDVDVNVLKYFADISTCQESCKFCNLQPLCQYLSACPTRKRLCDFEDRQAKIVSLKKQMVFEYELFKKNNSKKGIIEVK